MHIADMSFTFLHWKIMEELEVKRLSLEQIDDDCVEILCYNILPGGDTIMHKLCSHGEVIKQIYELAHPNEEDLSEEKFHIPFL